MFDLDLFEKNLTQTHFESESKLPCWLSDLERSSPTELSCQDDGGFPGLDITLVGIPDDVFRKKEGSLVLVDYKTARVKGVDDTSLPAYEIQQLLEKACQSPLQSGDRVVDFRSPCRSSDKPEQNR